MFLARTPAKKAPTPPRASTSDAGANNRAETKVPTPNASTQASCVRRSIGEWENVRLAESQPPYAAALSPPPKAVKVPAAPLKNSRKAAPQPDTRAVARRISTDESEASPGTSRMQPQKPTDRVIEARNLLVRVKSLLGESRNLRTDIKTGLIQAVERLYQLVKEQAAAASRERGVEAEKSECEEQSKHHQRGADPAMALQATKMEEHAELLRENTRVMKSLKEDLNKHREVIEKTTVATTYASVTATQAGTHGGKGLPTKETLHSVVVTAKDDQETCESVLDKIRMVVDAKEGWIEVKNVRKARDRKVIIGLSSEAERSKLKERLGKAKDLHVEEVKNRDPLLVLRGVLKMHSDSDILKALRNQNKDIFQGLGETDDRVGIRYRRMARNPHTCHLVVSVAPTIWQRAIAKRVVQIDLQPIRVEDQSPLVQCTRCLGYGHGKRFCTEPADLCSHCGGPHLRPDCADLRTGAPPSCVNCVKVKAKNTAHNAFDSTCEIRQKWDALARSTVAYS